jgi:hypothetical protein
LSIESKSALIDLQLAQMEEMTQKCVDILRTTFSELKADQTTSDERGESEIETFSAHNYSTTSKSPNISYTVGPISAGSVSSEDTTFEIIQSPEMIQIQEGIQFMLPQTEILSSFTEEVHQSVSGIPSSSDSHRIVVRNYLKSLIESSLNCSVLDLSDYSSDWTSVGPPPISLFILVGKPYQYSWHSIILDHISELESASSSLFKTADSLKETCLTPSKDFTISEIYINQFTENFLEKSLAVSVVVDGITVRVQSDPTVPLCLNGFVEEVSIFVGRNQLLQRSFSFCRLFLEQQLAQIGTRRTRAEAPTGGEYFLNDEALWVLVLMIFNKYDASRIINPLYCLFLLLVDMVNYNPAFHAITMFGLIDLSSAALRDNGMSSEGRRISIPVEKFFLPFSVLEKYMNLLNSNDSSTVSVPSFSVHPDIPFSSTAAATALIISPIKLSDLSPTKFLAIHPLTQKFICSSSYPLNTSNQSLSDLFHFGVIRFMNVFTKVNEYKEASVELSSSIKFQIVKELTTNAALWDAPSKVIMPPPVVEEKSLALLRSIHFSISYCRLIYKGIVTDSSLLFAVTEALELKGALPVGEVGKVISIHGEAAIIAKFIKDRYGGLKKYLERYPTFFVFGDDHEFNPHVYLIFKLSAEHKLKLDNRTNFISMEYLVQYRQVRKYSVLISIFSVSLPS